MVTKLISVILFTFFLSKINCINVEGPPKVRYRPCGLGPLYFEKINETNWKGVLDLGSYSSPVSSYPEIIITFEEDNTITETVTTDDYEIEKENRTLNIYVVELLKEPIVFDVKLNNKVNNSEPTVESFSLNGNIICDNETVWASHILDEPTNSSVEQDDNNPVCGQRCLGCEESTTLRTEAKDGDWPWHVALFRDNKYFCGGTIISKTAVVTSGWCGYYKNKTLPISVLAGASNLNNQTQERRQILDATEVILGPGYTTTHFNNLAIIKVNEFVFTQYVKPICLYGPRYNKKSFVGKEAVVAGFGGTSNQSSIFGVIRSTDTIIRSDAECKATFSSINLGVSEFNFCGGFGETSNLNPHHSDPGNGLIVSSIGMDQKLSWYLRGVFVSCYRKNNTCHPDRYALYFDVAPFYSWILYHSE